MSRSHQDKGISAEDLKRRMYKSLQSAGVLNQMKGFLRQSVIDQLKGKHTLHPDLPDSDLLAATIRRNEPSWVQKSLDNLIFHHLKQSRYHYALSLFQQESGIMDYHESLTDELLQYLGASDLLLSKEDKENDSLAAHPNSSIPLGVGGKKSKDSHLILWKILSRISSIEHLAENIDKDDSLRPKMSQQPRKTMTLADKLRAIDDEMDATVRERRQGDIEYRKSISTLAGATRRAEEAAERRAKESLEQWKKIELTKVKINEAEKTRAIIAEKTKSLEDDFSQRKEALLQREQNAIDRLNNQKELLEKDLHQQRQLLLQELEQIRMREKSLQNKEELLREMEVVKLKELDLLKAETFQHHPPIHHERSRRDSVMSSCAESLRKSLTGQESKQFEQVLNELRSRTDQVDILKQELMSLRDEFIQSKQIQSHYSPKASRSLPRDPVMPEYRKEESSSLRRRLDDLSSQLNQWKRQERETKEERIQEEIGRWKTEVAKLSATRDQMDDKQRQLEDMTLRLQQKISNSSERHQDPEKHSSASNLRILMDSPAKKKVINLLEDYEPVGTGHVRWADRMPRTIEPSSFDKQSRTALDSSDSSNLDDSNSTTTSYNSSRDISTSGIRLDIRRKFKTLDKESEELEEMYNKYIRSNYKHVSSLIPVARARSPVSSHSIKYSTGHRSSRQGPVVTGTSGSASEPRFLSSKDRSSFRDSHHSSSSSKSRKQPSTILTRDPAPVLPEYVPKIKETEKTKDSLDEEKSEQSQSNPNLDASGKFNDVQENFNSIPALSGSNEKSRDDREEDEVPVDENISIHEEVSQDELHLSSLKSRDVLPSPRSRQSKHPVKRELPGIDPPGYQDAGSSSKPVPTKRHSSLSPRSSKSASLPPISTESNENLRLGSPSRFGVLPSLEKTGTPAKDDNLTTSNTRKITVGEEKHIDSFSESSEEAPLKLSSLQAPENLSDVTNTARKNEQESPFQRPELLSRKVTEMQRSLDQSDDQDSSEQDPPRLSLEGIGNDENLDNILHSIDVNSARDIQDETNPNLTDLLNQLDPNKQQEANHPGEDVPAKGAEEESKEKSENEELISERSSNEYSGNFLSTTSSKTASEVKTMSDFEPSSTSIPRIEDKIGSHHQDNEDDKSEADVNWSNLQLDKSGEQLHSEITQDVPRAGGEEEERHDHGKKDVDIFEDSVSSHSLEAPSDGNEKGSRSAGEDEFW